MHDQLIAVSNMVLALIIIAPVLSVVIATLALISARRRSPPIYEEMYRDFIRRPELCALEERLSRERTETRKTTQIIFAEIKGLQQTNNASFTTIERALGRIEGSLNNHLGDAHT